MANIAESRVLGDLAPISGKINPLNNVADFELKI